MPYKQGKMWRAKVTIGRMRFTALKPTKREAAEWEAKKRDDLRNGKTPTDMDLLTFCNRYIDFAKNHFSKVTAGEKNALCKRILLALKNVPVSSVTPEMILDYLEDQVRERSANSCNKDRKNLMAMWAHGVKFYGFENNPALNMPKVPYARKPQYVPPVADVLRLLAAASGEERTVLDAILNTGARKSEIFRWTWHEDINFERRQVRLGTRKTRDGSMEYEWVPMSEGLHEALSRHWKERTIKDTPYVFVCTMPGRWHGHPYTTRRRFMAGLCKRAGIQPFGFHSLRRFVASYLADVEKVSAKQIQRILRHKSVHTTERYIRNLQEDLRDTYEALSNLEQKGTKPGTKIKRSEP